MGGRVGAGRARILGKFERRSARIANTCEYVLSGTPIQIGFVAQGGSIHIRNISPQTAYIGSAPPGTTVTAANLNGLNGQPLTAANPAFDESNSTDAHAWWAVGGGGTVVVTQ